MTANPHHPAQELIALGAGEALSDRQNRRLENHLGECAACRDYAEAAGRVIHCLRSLPLAADSRLVRATQMRVRFHADRLRQARERMWLTAVVCVGVGLSATVTAPLLWQLFAWFGEWAGIPGVVWQTAFMVFGFAPAMVVSVLFVARGTHLAHEGKRSPRGIRK